MNLESLSSYDFDLPQDLIAKFPVTPRDHSRLMVLDRGSQTIRHHRFFELPDLLPKNSVLVANNSRVIHSRLLGRRILPGGAEGGAVEFLLLDRWGETEWEGAMHASAKYVPGLRFRVINRLKGEGVLEGEVVRGSAESPSGTVRVRFNVSPLKPGFGEIPLPHYLDRKPEASDEDQYQTVYSRDSESGGSAAAPTAGLHFTPELLKRLKDHGVSWKEITLHVGLGTFRPVKTDDLSAHVMHEERFWVPAEVRESVGSRRSRNEKIVAVGTTTVRSLEAMMLGHEGATQIFIRPGHHEFKAVDAMITNFHLPKSTLLMLVSAFAGPKFVRRAYDEAVKERYRFFSFGDAMLIV